MKQLLIAIFLIVTTLTISAQDIIVTKAGEMISVYDVDVSDNSVYYKTSNSKDAQLVKVDKSTLFMLKKKGGTSVVFGNESAGSNSQSQQQATVSESASLEDISISAEENQNLKSKYEVDVNYKPDAKELKKKGKAAEGAYFQFGFGKDAVLADKNVELEFQTGRFGKSKHNDDLDIDTDWGIQMIVKNKTSKTIYIDMANTFFIRGQEAAPYYTPSATSQTHGKSSGGSVNLGAVTGALGIGGTVGTLANGVNVGGGSSNSSTTVTYSQRVISIPPMSSKKLEGQLLFLPEYKDVYGLNIFFRNDYYTKSYINSWGNIIYLKNMNIPLGEIKTWEEVESPIKVGTFLTYSLNENFSRTQTISTSLYAKKCIALRKKTVSALSSVPFGGYLCRDGITDNFNKSIYFIAWY